tara:strand:- start:43129 stop:43320 length:192 start_codon:yes stop_codon:yes gene_type:complete
MINNCPCCNKYPEVNVTVKCDNKLCAQFGEEHYVYEWQQLKKTNSGEIHLDEKSIMAKFNSLG